MKVLVTGANGFIGRQVVKHLPNDIEVYCVSRHVSTSDRSNIHWRQLDLLGDSIGLFFDRYSFDGCIHLAWYTHHKDYLTHEINHRWHEASVRLIDTFFSRGGKRFLGVGSCVETRNGIAAQTLYGQSKDHVRDHLLAVPLTADQSAAWGRVFFTFGPGQPESCLIPAMIAAKAANSEFKLNNPNASRDYTYSKDLGQQIARAFLSDISGVFDFGSGMGRCLGEIKNTIMDLTDPFKKEGDQHYIANMVPFKKYVGPLQLTDFTQALQETSHQLLGKKS